MIRRVLTAVLFLPAWLAAQNAGPPIEDRYIYNAVPDIGVTLEDSGVVPLSQLWRDRPLLITMVFSRCAGVCYPFLRSLRAAEAALGAGPSADYRILVLSFDPRDTARDMGAVASVAGAKGAANWSFGVAPAAEIGRLSEATGFWFRWDPVRRQYDHPAVLLAVKNGRLVRLFTGGLMPASALGAIVRELRGTFIASYPLPGDALFRCFQFDAGSQSFTPDWGALLLVLPGLAAGLIAMLIFSISARSRASGDIGGPRFHCCIRSHVRAVRKAKAPLGQASAQRRPVC